MNPAGITDILSKGSASFQRLNAHLLGGGGLIPGPKSSGIAADAGKSSVPKTRIRQSRDKLNKLESAYQDYATVEHRGHQVLAQAIRLRLGNGVWYKPDFFIPHLSLFIEVKGPKAFRGGFENLKVAAGLHTWAKFRLVWREKGQWFAQAILP